MLKNVNYNLLETITIVSKAFTGMILIYTTRKIVNPAGNYGQRLKHNEKKNYRCSLKN